MERKSKVVIITGASDGLGKEIALRLAKDDCFLILIARNEEHLKLVASKIGSRKSHYSICDISDNSQVEKVIDEVIKKYGRIDVLINNAGIWIEGELDKNKPKDVRRAIEINTLGQLYVTRAVIPIMKKQRSGLIINIISQAGLYGKAERSVYNASKWAMTGATKSLELDLKKYNIRVTGVYPGKLRTSMFQKAGIKKPRKDAIEPEKVVEAISWIMSLPEDVLITELGIKHIKN